MSDQEFNSNENFTNVPKSCVWKKWGNTGNNSDWCLSDEGGECYDRSTCVNRCGGSWFGECRYN
jgi:hypothetical protein